MRMPVVPAGAVIEGDGHATVFIESAPGTFQERSGGRRQTGGTERPRRQRAQSGRNDRRRRRDAAQRPHEEAGIAMLKRIVSLALNQPLFMMLLTVLFIGAGVQAFRSLPVEAFPDVTDVQVTVITLFAGPRAGRSREAGHHPARDRPERSAPLGADVLAHAVRPVVHHPDVRRSGQRLLRAAAGARAAAEASICRPASSRSSRRCRRRSARSTAIGSRRWRQPDGAPHDRGLDVERGICRMTPGVADVVSFGGFIKQYEVNLDPARMKSYGVSLQQVFTALGRGNANAGGSYLEQGEQQYIVRGIGLLRSADDIGDDRRRRARRHAAAGSRHRRRQRRRGAAPGHRRPGRRRRGGDRHRADAQGREPVGGAGGAEGARGHAQRVDPAARRADRAVLRPHVADRHDAEDGVQEPARRRGCS